MLDNKQHKDPRDIERRPPELRSARSSSGQNAKRQTAAQNEHRANSVQSERRPNAAQSERRSGELQRNITKSNTERSEAVQKSKAAPRPQAEATPQNSGKIPQNQRENAHAAPAGEKRRLSEQEKRLESRKKAILKKSREREHSLQCLNIAVIVAIMACAALFLNFGEHPKIDEAERRELAARPNFTMAGWFDGSFQSGFSAWFNDAVPGRSTFKEFIALYRTHLGIEYDDGVTIIGPVNDPNEVPPDTSDTQSSKPNESDVFNPENPTQSGTQSTSTPASTGKPNVDVQDVDGDMSGTVFVLGNGQGFSMFGGNPKGGEEYAGLVNELSSKLGDGVKVYSMVIPTAGSFYLPKKFQNKMASEWDAIEHINGFLDDGITPIDAYSALAAHSNEYIYFRTDHHWTQLGAYYAAEVFAKAAGVPYAPLSDYTVQNREGMLGSLYGYSKQNPNMKKNPDTFTFYKPKNDFTVTVYDPDYTKPRNMPLILSDAYVSVNNSYMVYGGDIQINHVQTDCDNGRKLVIIGDSYDNAMFLNLTNSFSEIWVVDMRAHIAANPYFDLNIVDFVQKMGATDVLFAMDTFSAVGSNRKGIRTMLDSGNLLPEN